MASKYDVVVIGAGNAGLTAALSLAKKGREVLLLERHNVPGGCATSFVRGRFEFEVALHQLSGMGTDDRPGPLRELLRELGVLDKLEFVQMKDLYRIIMPGVADIRLKAHKDEVVSTLKENFPKEKDSIDSFFDLVYEFCMQMIGGVYMHDPEISRDKYPLYFKYALKSSKEVLDHYFDDPVLKAVISPYWSYMGITPRHLSFSDLAILIFAYIEFKPFHIKGGSQALSNALLDTFIQHGGTARLNTPIEKIIIKDGRASGVVTGHGEQIFSDYVISNASTISTYYELLGPEYVPEEVKIELGRSTIGPSAFTLFLGLDCEPNDLGIEETTNFIGTSPDMEMTYELWKTLERPEMGLLSCYDVSDPDFSPKGASQAAFVTLQYAEAWCNIGPTEYYDTKYRYAESMLDLVEKAFPGIRGHLEEVEAATPLTHLRYLGHPGGAIYGFDQYAKDLNLFVSRRSPVDGLFLAGSWVDSGGFQPTLTSGRQAAKAVLKDMESKGVKR